MDCLQLAEESIKNNGIPKESALAIINTSDRDTFELLAAANKIRQHFKGNKIKLCAIVNAKSGKCSENCSFCAQSAHHKTNVESYPLMEAEEIVKNAKAAEKNMGATCFSIVTSGKAVNKTEDKQKIGEALAKISSETNMNRCVSTGTLDKETILELKKRGLKRLHHNLETAESYFDKVCTTHTYQERIDTLKAAKEAGIEICCGGIFNLGESLEQRIELAYAIKELDPVSVPINILNPIEGTPAHKNYKPISPLEVLRLIAAYRFILPDKDIGLFGGREFALRELQPLMFIAGANVTLVGNYLTTKGQEAQKDLRMIKDLGLEIAN
ncbi:biotin synthase BioB [candidate division WOR-1 bacterium RIFOXYA12_FULL_43_27]|uniref:Biotin synthase n=1 Tax=candidate division WOR-1 bacterium RIFOXYC2_FULL_46_14 TaxID=1802587 RepID=A0A1F4U6K9_UNCSA|nr:MAG: biotin synthase BioB [candidate division WOR-1 bacterium RIFOXYA12_FULL_43_27]OGC19538.1 MAG: biotin synthase BioB [candidate division WOR-1 bacterium RIFOXYB2_FULL_46_45]OGC30526.1 MAG: biotin synthase BioB [candidate division WOR-1 bacterium RIFOXYA2_FULL_46_56]OGC40594.1 MAG: biotin synthase BioB [candidate division WOR-1 bacterium RIFOXYC2_FULL_46_14]